MTAVYDDLTDLRSKENLSTLGVTQGNLDLTFASLNKQKHAFSACYNMRARVLNFVICGRMLEGATTCYNVRSHVIRCGSMLDIITCGCVLQHSTAHYSMEPHLKQCGRML